MSRHDLTTESPACRGPLPLTGRCLRPQARCAIAFLGLMVTLAARAAADDPQPLRPTPPASPRSLLREPPATETPATPRPPAAVPPTEQPAPLVARPAGPGALAAAPRQGAIKASIVAIMLKSDPEYGVYLQDVEVLQLGRNAAFLVGTGVDTGYDDWTPGRRIWIALDDVSQIIEFESFEALEMVLDPEPVKPDA